MASELPYAVFVAPNANTIATDAMDIREIFGAVGDGLFDDTAVINYALSTGVDLFFPPGLYLVSTLTNKVAKQHLTFAPGAILVKIGSASDVYVSGGLSGPSYTDLLQITAPDVTIDGINILCAGTWDATNDGIIGRNACSLIRITNTAPRCTINNCYFINVPKLGIVAVDADDIQINNPRIDGNFPVGLYTGTNTGHFGISLDPSNTLIQGRGKILGGRITGCVQGIQQANFGAGIGSGYIIDNVTFQDCHNHGIYQQSGPGAIITNNSFVHCQVGVVASGTGVIVEDNTFYTASTGGTDDMVGISGRDLIDAVIGGNTLIGDNTASFVPILVDCILGTSIQNVVIDNNNIDCGVTTGHPLIRVGASAVTLTNVEINNNIVKGGGQPSTGLIHVFMAASQTGEGVSITNNEVTITGNSHGIMVVQQKAATIRGNSIRNEFSAGSNQTQIHIYLNSVVNSSVKDTTSFNLSGAGANLTIDVIRDDAACSNNIIETAVILHEAGLTATVPILILGTGEHVLTRRYQGTAIPANGTWQLGDRVDNSSPVVGNPKGWVCTVAGSPGTWVSEGNL